MIVVQYNPQRVGGSIHFASHKKVGERKMNTCVEEKSKYNWIYLSLCVCVCVCVFVCVCLRMYVLAVQYICIKGYTIWKWYSSSPMLQHKACFIPNIPWAWGISCQLIPIDVASFGLMISSDLGARGFAANTKLGYLFTTSLGLKLSLSCRWKSAFLQGEILTKYICR